MKVSILADIHGNSLALAKVLNDIEQFDCELSIILGDSVGYYYWPDKVLELLNNFIPYHLISGNHECMLKSALENREKFRQIKLKYGSGIHMAAQKLTVDQQQFLIDQPAEREIKVDDCSFFACHGSPFDRDQYVYPDAPVSLLERCALNDFDFVLMGHTHHPFCFKHNNTMVVNPGSAGQPRDIGNSSSYVIVDTIKRSVMFRRVPFNTELIIAECEKIDPELLYLKDVLIRNNVQSEVI